MKLLDLIETFQVRAPKAGGLAARGTPDDIGKVQVALKGLGYYNGNIDGILGPQTAGAVRQFQKDNDLKVDGDPGVKTVPKINQALKDKNLHTTLKPVKIDKPKAGVSKKRGLPPLKNDAKTKGKIGAVLDFIARPESGGAYDAVYPGKNNPAITNMTLDELFKDMKRRAKFTGSSASGRYQYTQQTLREIVKEMGLSGDTKFTPKVQDQIAVYHLRKKHGLDKWMNDEMSTERFLAGLARTWAGLPDPKTGDSYYSGVLDNKAGIKTDVALAVLDSIQGAA